MGKEIRVVYEDILKTSNVFKACGKRYDAIVPKDTGPIPVVTDASLKNALSVVLRAIAVLHDSLGSSLQAHGDKLKYVHDRYRNTEDDIDDLLRIIDDPDGIKPDF